MRKVAKLLAPAIDREEVLRAARAAAVLRRWDEVVGDSLASRSAPDRYERGTVWVAVRGSAWAQELRMIKPRILERLGALASEAGLFHDVRFGVRPFQVTGGLAEVGSEAPPKAPLAELSIREIAERRRRFWGDAKGT
ncbi:MAG: DUF721 domain-containing protein [Fimbriimonas ginsengisoli]|uniref:DUF721 domain-containing protein n=1 Tax=Fimbriimonas ginsengisoli TaxID=1005039 RepID=A0A931LV91_FIMGI|nr:DUF721 domain-containing protein [Fimbriimonas ginsengisoli]